ncbi:MAG: hypothetical protein C3F19_11165 [Rhodocyclales bacterium]|nr:MAG: hypothetical protein C3F19_11165 [Rhodocyclales bacterium]
MAENSGDDFRIDTVRTQTIRQAVSEQIVRQGPAQLENLSDSRGTDFLPGAAVRLQEEEERYPSGRTSLGHSRNFLGESRMILVKQ